MADRGTKLHDGRTMGITGLGDPAASRIVVLCHPAPGAAGFDPDPTLTGSWGVHMLSMDRPGYASSTPLPVDLRPSIGQHADDIADYVGRIVQQAQESGRTAFDKIGVVGWAAGGRVALALAARHPGLVDRVAVVAAPAPDSAVRWRSAEERRVDAEVLALPVPDAKRRISAVLEGRAPGVQELVGGDADAAALERAGLRGRLQRMVDAAYLQGTTGLADDLLSSAGDDWGFDLRHVRARTLLVYGAEDALAPSAHGRWYRRHLPHARLTVVPHAGHLVIVDAWRRLLEHLDPQHGSRSDVRPPPR